MRVSVYAAAVLCFGMLSACVSAPPETTEPVLTFAHMQPVALNVAKIEVFDEYRPTMQDPYVDHLMPSPPASATKTLVKEKLQAAGESHLLRIVIDDASVVRENLPVTEGFWGAFSQEPSERYKAKVSLRFELVNEEAPDIIIGHATVIGKRTKTLIEGESPAARDHAMTELTESLMTDLYDGFDTVVRGTFGRL